MCRQILLQTNQFDAVDKFGRTALHYAAIHDNSAQVLRILLKQASSVCLLPALVVAHAPQGIPVTIADQDGHTSIHLAAKAGRKLSLDWLLEQVRRGPAGQAGLTAAINAKDRYGCTPLHYAVSLLTQHSTNYLCAHFVPLFVQACDNNAGVICSDLLRSDGVNVDERDNLGYDYCLCRLIQPKLMVSSDQQHCFDCGLCQGHARCG